MDDRAETTIERLITCSEPTRFSETYDPDRPIVVQFAETIKARAFRLFMVESEVAEGEFQTQRTIP